MATIYTDIDWSKKKKRVLGLVPKGKLLCMEDYRNRKEVSAESVKQKLNQHIYNILVNTQEVGCSVTASDLLLALNDCKTRDEMWDVIRRADLPVDIKKPMFDAFGKKGE